MTKALKIIFLVLFWGFTFSSSKLCALACADVPKAEAHDCCDDNGKHDTSDKKCCSGNIEAGTLSKSELSKVAFTPLNLPLLTILNTFELDHKYLASKASIATSLNRESPKLLFISGLLSSPNAPPRA